MEIFAHGKIKSVRKSLEKKRKQKKRKQAQRNKNTKNFSVKATGLAELYAGAVKQRFAKHDVKASTSLDTKTLIIVSNRNFESFMSIRCLAPQHIFRFFHFCYRFFLCPWQLCSLLCRLPPRFAERSRLKNKQTNKKTCLQWVTFSGKSWSIVIDAKRSRCPSWFAVSGGVVISWRASCLRTIMS